MMLVFAEFLGSAWGFTYSDSARIDALAEKGKENGGWVKVNGG